MNRFQRGTTIGEYIVWLNDGSKITITARSMREAIQLTCKKYFLTEKDIDTIEKPEIKNNGQTSN